MTRRYDQVKRALDVGAATVLLILTAPVQLIVAALVAAKLGRPVLFRQERPGRNGRIFRLTKFRTMLEARPDAGYGNTDADRLTPFGRWLRSTSLDELPSLWHVIRGEMSIVGPRPLHVRYLERYSPAQARRHEVRPGITGLAQVSGRNALDWDARLRLDTEYVDRRSLALDLRILALTVGTVLRRRGISADGHATVEEFRGSTTSGSAQ